MRAVARKASRPGSNGSDTLHVGAAAARDRLERVELERREVVEAVDEQRRAAPGVRVAAQGVERAPGEQVGVDHAGAVEPRAVAAVERRHLLRVGAPRAVARPVAQRAREARRVDHRAPELGHEARGGAHEPGLRRRLGEHVEARRAAPPPRRSARAGRPRPRARRSPRGARSPGRASRSAARGRRTRRRARPARAGRARRPRRWARAGSGRRPAAPAARPAPRPPWRRWRVRLRA